jgi:hypothetical protein
MWSPRHSSIIGFASQAIQETSGGTWCRASASTWQAGRDVFAYFKHEETPEGALYAVDLLRDAEQNA